MAELIAFLLPEIAAGLVIFGLMCAGVVHSTALFGQKRVGAGLALLLFSLSPVWALLAGAVSEDIAAINRNRYVDQLPRRPLYGNIPRRIEFHDYNKDEYIASLLDSGLFDSAIEKGTSTLYFPVRSPDCVQHAVDYIRQSIALGPIISRANIWNDHRWYDGRPCVSKTPAPVGSDQVDAIIFSQDFETSIPSYWNSSGERVEVSLRQGGHLYFIDYRELPADQKFSPFRFSLQPAGLDQGPQINAINTLLASIPGQVNRLGLNP